MYISFIVGSNSELVGKESSRAHDNNITLYTSIYYVWFYRSYGTNGQNIIDEQTDGKLLYSYPLICTWLHNYY